MTPPTDATVDRAPAIDPRIRERRVAIQRSRGRRRLRWLLAVIGAAVLVIGVVLLLHTPWFNARVVTVTGAHPHTSTAAIEAAAGLVKHPPLIDVDTGAAARGVEGLPFIATARVSRHWPDGVGIAVTERVPVAEVAGPGTSWSVLDGFGRTLEVQPGPVPGLPVFAVHTSSGPVTPAPVGGRLPPAAADGLRVARTLPKAFSGQVAALTVAADDTVTLALNSGITVELGTATDLSAKYEDAAAILARGTLQATSVIDVTVPASPTVGP
jgi:cell division protein FtsQ